MASTEEINKEYWRLNKVAGQTKNELDHNSLMERINLYELYYKRELLMDSIIIYSLHGNKVNPHYG